MGFLANKTSVDKFRVNEIEVYEIGNKEERINHFNWLLSILNIVCHFWTYTLTIKYLSFYAQIARVWTNRWQLKVPKLNLMLSMTNAN